MTEEFMSDFDEEEELSQLLNLITETAENYTNGGLQVLENALKRVHAYILAIEDEGEYQEIYVDIEFELAPILNGSDFRADCVTESAITDSQFLDLIYTYIAVHNENVEVVLATNPYISEDLKWKLAKSTFEWEEDGTRLALARNHSDQKLLAYLASEGNFNVRHQVALNPSTPPEVLENIAHDTAQCNFQMEEYLFGEVTSYKGFARWCVANNPSTDRSTLQKILHHEFEQINPEAEKLLEEICRNRLNA